MPATLVRIVDDLRRAPGQLAYVAGSATLNGSTAGITVTGTDDRRRLHRQPGDLATGRDRRRCASAPPSPSGLAIGTRVTNTGVVSWNDPAQTASASVAFDVGGMIGVGVLGGRAWHDANFNRTADAGERVLAGLERRAVSQRPARTHHHHRRRRQLADRGRGSERGCAAIGTITAAAAGDQLELRFTAPGATATTAKLGYAHSVFGNDLQRIHAIVVQPGSNLLAT